MGLRDVGLQRPLLRRLGEVPGGCGVSTLGNTLGATGTVLGPVVLAGLSGVTLSESRQGNQATITIIASAESAGVAIGAGTQTATSGTVIFSNANNITFGLNGQTLTASFNGGGGPAISAGTQLASSGTVVFSNSNNITFGLSNGTLTASFSQTADFAIAAGTQTGSTGTIVFSNSNGITFGLSGSTRVTASHNGVSELGIQDSAGVGVNQGIPRLVFATSAGANVTFGKSVNGGTLSVTANVAAVNVAAGAATASSGTVIFSNSNNVTFGLNGQTLTASINAAAGPSIGAGTVTATSGTVIFSNSNGVTFGLNGQTLTASFANTISISGWENYGAADLNATTMGDIQHWIQRVHFAHNIAATEANLIAQVSNSTNAGGSITIRMGIYTMSGSTASLASSASRTIGYNSTAAASSYTALSGYRYRSIPLGTWNITPGDYMIGVVVSISTSGTSGSYSWKARRNLPLEVAEFGTANTDNYFWYGSYLTVTGNLRNSFRPQDVGIQQGAGAADENDQPWFNLLGTF